MARMKSYAERQSEENLRKANELRAAEAVRQAEERRDERRDIRAALDREAEKFRRDIEQAERDSYARQHREFMAEQEQQMMQDQTRQVRFDPEYGAVYVENGAYIENGAYVDPGQWQFTDRSMLGNVYTKNTIKPTVHKAGHFPIGWMNEAFERAEQSDKIIIIQLEKNGVTVIGQEGDSYETHTLSWEMMDKAEVNPIILGIQTVEKHLDTLGRLKERMRA